MKIFYSDHFVLPLPDGHRFPMSKYSRLRERVSASGLSRGEPLLVPMPAAPGEIVRAHDTDYMERVFAGNLTPEEVRRMGFPWSPELVERSRRSSGATIEAARAALCEGIAVNLAGGTHHAFAARAEGYCVFNDSAIAARAMQAEGRAGRILVVDCDVHQGNGTAAIFADDPTVFTFSIHGERNFPYRKEISDLDIALPDGTTDVPYLDALRWGLDESMRRAHADLVIYLAGADPLVGDRFGRLALTKAGLEARDRFVLEALRAARMPVVITMAGGYSPNIDDTVDVHFATVAIAAGCLPW